MSPKASGSQDVMKVIEGGLCSLASLRFLGDEMFNGLHHT